MWDCQRQWATQHKGITNHATFIDAIERWRFEIKERVCFVTFNYDTMLEEALGQTLQIGFENFEHYVSHPSYQLIKLHGSIDWAFEVFLPQVPRTVNEVLHGALSLHVDKRFRKAGMGLRFDDGTIGFPALALPVEKKSEFVCPQDHIQVLGNSISSVTKIIAIGWRATEQHFLEMLHKSLTGVQGDVDLMVVSGDERGCKETTDSLAIGGRNPQCKRAMIEDGFTGLITRIGYLEQFLR